MTNTSFRFSYQCRKHGARNTDWAEYRSVELSANHLVDYHLVRELNDVAVGMPFSSTKRTQVLVRIVTDLDGEQISLLRLLRTMFFEMMFKRREALSLLDMVREAADLQSERLTQKAA